MQIVLKTGIDLIEIERLTGLQPAIRERFIRRVFTEQEIIEADNSDQTLCGRFAAKEAASKALGSGIGEVKWQEFEIRRGSSGEPNLNLSGKALDIARAQNIFQWSVSISHSKAYAVAVVVGLGTNPEGV